MVYKKEEMKNLLVVGNSTMPNSVGIFNLPPLITCRPSLWCKLHCYALKNRFVWKSIKKVHAQRLRESKKKGFVSRMLNELASRKSIKYVRIHITGDFYNKEYVDKWAEIVKSRPDILFRTNTKRFELLLYMKKVFPKNVVVRESTDPSRKCRGIFPQAAIEGTRGSDKFFKCINDCEKCKFYCWKHPKVNILLSIL